MGGASKPGHLGQGSRARVIVLSLISALLAATALSNVPSAASTAAAASTSGSTPRPTYRLASTSAGGAAIRPAPSGQSVPTGSVPPAADEVVGLRTRTSRTYLVNGEYEAVVSSGSVNYQTSSGAWEPINDTLVPSDTPGYAWTNQANAYTALFPATLSAAPVVLQSPQGTVELQLAGAGGGTATVSGASVTYANALPDVTVTLTAENDAVKETLTLTGPGAPTSLSYSLGLSSELTATALGGGVEITDPGGKVQFALAAPTMSDATGTPAPGDAATLAVASTAAGQTVSLNLASSWLHSSARQWPVVIDPTINYTPDQDCYIENGSSANSNFCGNGYLAAGYDGTSVYRSPLLFNIQDVIPAGAQVTHAGLEAYVSDLTTSNYGAVNAYQLTQGWTEGVTWNDYDGTHAWTTAGGTYASNVLVSKTPTGAGYYSWNGPTMSALAQSWLSGTQANDGILLAAANEANDEVDVIQSSNNWSGPYFYVYYVNALGELPTYGTESQQLTDRSGLEVNVANGNLVVTGNDLQIQGTGLNLSVERIFNSLSEGDAFGTWLMGSGVDELLTFVSGDVFYQGPGGFDLSFYPNGSGGYISPPGLNSTLVENSNGSYTLTNDSSHEQLNFSSSGVLTSDVDRNGDTITYTMSGSNLSSITDTQGRQVTFSYTSSVGSNLISKITDSTGRTWQYGYTSASGYDELTSYTDPNGKQTTYDYNSSGLISEIVDPLGNETLFGYNADAQVTSITRVINTSTGAGPKTSYSYYPDQQGSCATPSGDVLGGYTVSTNPDGFSTTYCYDLQGLVIQTIDADSYSSSASYTSDQQVAVATDPLSESTTASYNSNNDPTEVVEPADGTGQTGPTDSATFTTPSTVAGYQYLPSSVTDAEGNCTAYVYDSAGNLTDTYAGQSSPCAGDTGGVHAGTRYQGDTGVSCGGTTGEVCEVIDGNGNDTTYGYNSAGENTSITPPSPQGAEAITYDSLSRVASVTDGKSQKTTSSYDGDDRVTQILYGGATTCTPSTGDCISYTYDGDGNETSMTDQSGTTDYYYDALNRLTTESLPDTSSDCSGSSPAGITYGYDPAGNMITYCDSGGTTTYSYDPDGRLIAEAEPGGYCPTASTPTFVQGAKTTSSTSLAFPQGVKAGDLLVLALTTNDSGTDPITGVSDTLNGAWTRAKSEAYGNGHVDLYYYQGSAAGPDTVTIAGGSAAFTIAEYAGVAATSALDQVAGHASVNTSTLSAGPTSSIGGAGELVLGVGGEPYAGSSFSAGSGFTLEEQALDPYLYSVGLEGKLSSSSSGQSMTMGGTSGYWGAIVAVFKAAPAASLCTTFGYDANGDRTLITFPGGATQSTTFDNDGDVTSVVGKSSTGTTLTSFSYTYTDGADDILLVQSRTENDAVASNTYTYTYASVNDLTAAAVSSGSGTSYSYSYDADGNMLTKTAGSTTTTYAYNAGDELCWAYTGTSSNGCSSAPSGATTYSFDADGNETASSAGASFSYNTKNQTTAITYGGTTLSGLAYTDQGQDERISAGSTTFDNSAAGTAISTTSGTSTHYFYDNQGDILGERIGSSHYYFLTDALGSVVAVINGSGQTVSDRYGYDPYGITAYQSGSLANPFGYAGGYTDPTGLIHLGARYYDPTTSRWTQSDPAGQGYSYADDEPINDSDPDGLFAGVCCGQQSSWGVGLSWWNPLAGYYQHQAKVHFSQGLVYLLLNAGGGAAVIIIGAIIAGLFGNVAGVVVGAVLGVAVEITLWWVTDGGSMGVWIIVDWRTIGRTPFPTWPWGGGWGVSFQAT